MSTPRSAWGPASTAVAEEDGTHVDNSSHDNVTLIIVTLERASADAPFGMDIGRLGA